MNGLDLYRLMKIGDFDRDDCSATSASWIFSL